MTFPTHMSHFYRPRNFFLKKLINLTRPISSFAWTFRAYNPLSWQLWIPRWSDIAYGELRSVTWLLWECVMVIIVHIRGTAGQYITHRGAYYVTWHHHALQGIVSSEDCATRLIGYTSSSIYRRVSHQMCERMLVQVTPTLTNRVINNI